MGKFARIHSFRSHRSCTYTRQRGEAPVSGNLGELFASGSEFRLNRAAVFLTAQNKRLLLALFSYMIFATAAVLHVTANQVKAKRFGF